MPLRKDYADQACSMARSLETVGERWTLLIVRDAFFGVRRFSDFAAHLHVPRAVLTDRLGSLVREDVLEAVPGSHGHTEYVLTDKGLSLWPVVRGLLAWGDEHYSPNGPRRVFLHAADGGRIGADGQCADCEALVPVQQTVIAPGPGMRELPADADLVAVVLASRHQLLEPVRG